MGRHFQGDRGIFFSATELHIHEHLTSCKTKSPGGCRTGKGIELSRWAQGSDPGFTVS